MENKKKNRVYLNPSLRLSNVKFIALFRKNNKIKCNCFSIIYEKEDSGFFLFWKLFM